MKTRIFFILVATAVIIRVFLTKDYLLGFASGAVLAIVIMLRKWLLDKEIYE